MAYTAPMTNSPPRDALFTPKARALNELSAVRELTRLPRFFARQRHMPQGTANVLVLPGFMTGDGSTWVLRAALRRLGHRVQGWGMGRNRGDVPALVEALAPVLRRVAADGPVHLIGWSLGGYLAREIARDQPECVAQVITMASPVVGGPKYTAAADYYVRQGIDLEAWAREIVARDAVPLTMPITAIYSPIDTVVCPAACLDYINPQTDHVAVHCSHAGLGFSPTVFDILAARLAREFD